MRYEYTDGHNKDFIELCCELDDFLNELVGGEEKRSKYIPYNKLDDIHDVVIVYENDIPVSACRDALRLVYDIKAYQIMHKTIYGIPGTINLD